jgi:hypothetical protein
VKLQHPDPERRQIATRDGRYEMECRLYQAFRNENPLLPPHCYFAATDPDVGAQAVVLEDLTDSLLPLPPEGGYPLDALKSFVYRLGRYQANYWGGPTAELDWIPLFRNYTPRDALQDRYELAKGLYDAELMQRVSGLLPKFRDLYDNLGEAMVTRPLTLAHNELWPDNVLSTTTGLRVLDWQTCRWAAPGCDLGYALVCLATTEQRQSQEGAFLEDYLRGLIDGGVTGFAEDDAWRQYCLGCARTFGFALGSARMMATSERGKAISSTILDRSSQAVMDLGAIDFLGV